MTAAVAPIALCDEYRFPSKSLFCRPCLPQRSTERVVRTPLYCKVRAQPSSIIVADVQLRKDTYTRLTPIQRLQVARHPNRPTFLDIALNITDKFVELHGDRAGLDDPAMVCGLASIDGISFMFIGQQKGRNTKVSHFALSGLPTRRGPAA